MKHIILSLMLVTAFTCQSLETPNRFPNIYRCENDEIICYMSAISIGYGGSGGLFCKFKEDTK